MKKPVVLVGVPVFQSADIVSEALDSILAQSHSAFEVLISVDACDDHSADVCERYVRKDSRFRMVVHSKRLGWAGNVNYTLREAQASGTGDYFCYWPHDDLAAPNYFEALISMNAPEAAIRYSDLIWFGDREGYEGHEAISGSPLQRVLLQVERIAWTPFGGLVRMDAIRKAGLLRVNSHDSIYEDAVWLARVAREGSFARLPEPLSFKRCGPRSTHVRQMAELDQPRRRDAWLTVTAGFIAAAWPAVARKDDGWWVLRVILAQMLTRNAHQTRHWVPQRRSVEVISSFVADAIERVRAEGEVSLPEKLGDWTWAEITTRCVEVLLRSDVVDFDERRSGTAVCLSPWRRAHPPLMVAAPPQGSF